MNITEKIDKYLNEDSLPQDKVKKAIKWVDKKFPRADVGIIWYDGKYWYSFDYEGGGVSRKKKEKEWKDLGMGRQEEWEETRQRDLEKVLGAEIAYVPDL